MARMGNRGNQDHYKIAGTRTEDRDLTRRAHEHFTKERAVERRSPHEPTGPKATPLFLHIPPKFAEPTPSIPRMTAEPARPHLEPRGSALPSFHPATLGTVVRFVAGTARSALRYATGAVIRAGRESIERRARSLAGRLRFLQPPPDAARR